MQYTVKDDRGTFVFTGFTSYQGEITTTSQHIVITKYQGECEIWLTDGTKLALENLEAMFYRLYEDKPQKIVICQVLAEKVP